MTDNERDIEETLNTYAPLVRRIARSAFYSSSAIDLNDLCQVGEIAVLRAIKAYDPSCGTNIKSFVTRVVRQDIYNEAARFMGVFTVDHRVTNLAAKVNQLHVTGHTDEQILETINHSSGRAIDLEQVRDLRIAYNRRNVVVSDFDNTLDEEQIEKRTIYDLLNSIVSNDIERVVLERRIMGTADVTAVAEACNVSNRKIYQIEGDLKARIKHAIEDMVE